MGIGEPITNVGNVIDSMRFIRDNITTPTRFAVATCIPEKHINDFFNFILLVKEHNLEVKLHFSLHYTNDDSRRVWMPTALNIPASIALLNNYNIITGMPLEIHYTPIEGVNDSIADAFELGTILGYIDCTVKFLRFNEKQNLDAKPSLRLDNFIEAFKVSDIEYEIYTPPGRDTGSSCGAFLMDEYIENN
jgi:adenine C2-methylase RlmN of 23S rRNA A2503 and tRNA A37